MEKQDIVVLLNCAISELGNIETLSKTGTKYAYGDRCQSILCESRAALNHVFQHSQRGLNALHDLKNALAAGGV
jgi:hypothetical protein